MFGFIYFLSTLFGSGIEHLRRDSIAKDSKKHCIELQAKGENPCGVYYDWRGCARDLATDKKVITWREPNGHLIVKEVGGSVLRDVTQEKNDRLFEEQIRKGVIAIKVIAEVKGSGTYEGFTEVWKKYTGKSWSGNPWFDFVDYVYVHCKTNRYCIKRYINFGRTYGFNLQAIELIKGAKPFNTYYFVDIHSGEILDRYENESGRKEQPMVCENGVDRYMTDEEEKEGIALYFNLIKSKKIEPKNGMIGTPHLLASLLPEYYKRNN